MLSEIPYLSCLLERLDLLVDKDPAALHDLLLLDYEAPNMTKWIMAYDMY